MATKKSEMSFADYELQNRKRTRTDNFLDEVDRLIDWVNIKNIIIRNYKRSSYNAAGSPSYPVLKMFKVLLLQTWYDLSDPLTEEALLDRISFQRFTGFSSSDDIPDYSTICRFRNELLNSGLYDKLFRDINRQLEKMELMVKKGVIIDATVIESSRRPRKTIEVMPEDRKEDEQEPESDVNIKYSDDTDARWLSKGGKAIYGYKAHVMVDSKDGFVLGGVVTPANEPDINHMEDVIAEGKIKPGTKVHADKGYASRDNRKIIKHRKLVNGIMKKAARGHPLNEKEKSWNKKISQVRYKVERTFGTLKRLYGFSRMRYLGIKKGLMEFYLKAMAFNLRKAVNLLAV